MITEEQNQPLQQHNVNGCPGDSETIEILRKKVADQQRTIHDKEQRLADCAEEYRQMCSMQIAQLRAVQMLYDVMAAGHTHRQKEVFAEVIAQKIRDTKTKDKLAIMKDKQYNDYEFSNLKSA